MKATWRGFTTFSWFFFAWSYASPYPSSVTRWIVRCHTSIPGLPSIQRQFSKFRWRSLFPPGGVSSAWSYASPYPSSVTILAHPSAPRGMSPQFPNTAQVKLIEILTWVQDSIYNEFLIDTFCRPFPLTPYQRQSHSPSLSQNSLYFLCVDRHYLYNI